MLRALNPRLLFALDFAAAMLLFYVRDGFTFGSGDDLGFVPWVYRWEDASLLRNDLRFGDWPNAYYFFHLGYMFLLSKLMLLEWGFIVSSMLARLLLLVAMQRLARRLTGQYVPALLLAMLMIGYSNNHLVAGYYLTSPGFSTHYIAIALILLAIDWFQDNRLWLAFAALVPAALLNPRLGMIGVGMIALIWFWYQPAARKWLAVTAAAIVGVIVVAALTTWLPRQLDGTQFDEVLRAWTLIRSTWHFAPAAWDGFVFANLALVTAFLLATCRMKTDRDARTLEFIALLCMALIFAGILNNWLLIVPGLVLANPFQLGPLVLASCYIFMAVILVERLARGRLPSTLIILLVPDLETRLLLMLVAIVADWRRPSRQRAQPSRWPFDTGEAITLAAQVAVFALARMALTGSWQQTDYHLVRELHVPQAFICIAAIAALSWMRLSTPLRVLGTTGLVFILLPYYTHHVDGIRIRYDLAPDTVALCRYIVANTGADAIFVVPPEMHNFQADCRRAAFVTFTHLPLRLEKFPEWVARLKLLRVVPPDTNLAELKAPLAADFNAYNQFGKGDFMQIKKTYDNVEYALVKKDMNLDLPLVYENGSFRLYGLN